MLIHSPLFERAPSCRTVPSPALGWQLLSTPPLEPGWAVRGAETHRDPSVLQSLSANTPPVTCSFWSPHEHLSSGTFCCAWLCWSISSHTFTFQVSAEWELVISPACDSSFHSQNLSLECQNLLVGCVWLQLFHYQWCGHSEVAAQALTISGADLRVCTAVGFYVTNSLQSFGINWCFSPNKRSWIKTELDLKYPMPWDPPQLLLPLCWIYRE